MEANRMLPIRRNRRVATVTVGVIGLAVLHLAAATAAAARFGGHRRPRSEHILLSAGDDRARPAIRATAPGLGWTVERHPYLRNGTQQRIRLHGSGRSISSFARSDTSGSSRDSRKRKSRVALLLLLRGGSEGLKREAYDPRKAAEPSGSVRSSEGPFPATPSKRHHDYKCGDADKAQEGLRHWGSSASPPAIDPSMLSPTAEVGARGASPTPPQVVVAPYEGALSYGASLGVGQPRSIFDAPPASKSGSTGGLVDRREAIRAILVGAADDASVTDYGSAAGDRRAAGCPGEAVAGHEVTSIQSIGETCRRRDAGSGAVPPSEGGDPPSWERRVSAPTSSLEASGAAAADRERSPGEGGGASVNCASDALSPAGLGASQAAGGAGSFLPGPGLDSNDCSERPCPGAVALPEAPMPGDAEPLTETGATGRRVFSSSNRGLEVSSRGLAGAVGQALAVPKQKPEQQQQQLAPVGNTGSPLRQQKWKWKPKYLAVKAVYFLFYSSLGAIMPYLPVYYHSLALPDRQIGHLGAITPAMTFLFTPLWGALTDRSGMLKQILVATFLVSTLLRVSLAARTSFAWIMSVIALTAIVNAPVRPLLDSSALQTLDDRGEYGKQRLWGQWGFGIGSFLTGRLLSRFGFKAAFYMHAAFSIPTLLILLRFTPRKEDRTKGPPRFGELYRLMVHDPDVTAFFSMVFAIGLSSGVIENFAYKRLRELGASGSVLGISRLVSSLAGIPMFFFSGRIVKNFSIVAILTAAMMSYIARFVIYASIKNPWAGLPAEALRGVTFAGFWAASTCHVGEIAPPGLSTTMLGLLNATYGGIGQSLGSLIGGSLSARFGTARAFVVYAGFDGLLLLAFFSFWGVRLRAHDGVRQGGSGGGSSSQGGGETTPPLSPAATTATATATAMPFPWREETLLERAHAPSSESRSR